MANLQGNHTTRQNWQALYTWPSPPQSGPATARLYESNLKGNEAILWRFWSVLHARRAVGVQVIYCHLWQRALLSIKLLTYAPNNNTGLPSGQKQTTKSLKKYSFSIFGVYSFYAVADQRPTEWPSGWLCSWSRASDSKELILAVRRSLRDTGEGIFMPA